MWLAVAVMVIVPLAVQRYTARLTTVTLTVDGTSEKVHTRRQTVRQLIEDTGVVVNEWDRMTPADLDAPLYDNIQIVIWHAAPVTVLADGREQTVHTLDNDIHAILEQANLSLGPGDQLWINGQLTTDVDTVYQAPPYRQAATRGNRPLPAKAITNVEIQRATSFYLHDKGMMQTLHTTQRTVGHALHEANLILYLGDRIFPDLNTSLTAGMHIYIRRGKPVSVLVDGRTLRTRTHNRTVAELLSESGVALVGQDFVIPAPDTQISDGLQVQVVRVSEAYIIEQEQIPYQTEWLPDPNMELDQRRVDHVGTNGVTRRRYKAVYHDGQEVARTLEDQWVAHEPESRQIAYGTKIVVRTLETPDAGTIEYWRRIRVFLTSYTEATCGKTPDHPWYGKTRIGWQMRHGIIAVDPTVIPMLTEMYVTGYGKGIAADTGGMIKGKHIDLGHEVDNFVMYYWWGYTYLLTPVPPADQIRWILPDFPRE